MDRKPGISSVISRNQLVLLTVLFSGYSLYGLNRKAVAVVMPELILNNVLKDDDEAGVVISWQNISYTISKFLGGMLSDRYSCGLLFSSGLFVSGLSTVLFGMSHSDNLSIYCIIWFMNGLWQGLGWPACVKLVRVWFDARQLGTYWSILSASTNVSGALAPLLSAFITMVWGWRATMWVFGLCSMVMAILAYAFIVDNPERGTQQTKTCDNNSGDNGRVNDHDDTTIGDVLRSSFLWVLCVSYLIVFATKSTLSDWGQLYLMNHFNQSKMQASCFTSMLECGGLLGSLASGYVTDRIMAARTSPTSPPSSSSGHRMPTASLLMLFTSLSLHWLSFHADPSTITPFSLQLVSFILGVSLYGLISLFGVMASESAPPHLSGTSHAIVALAANFGAILSGLPITMLAKHYSWRGVFLMFECLSVCICLLLIIAQYYIKTNFYKIKID